MSSILEFKYTIQYTSYANSICVFCFYCQCVIKKDIIFISGENLIFPEYNQNGKCLVFNKILYDS